MTEPVAVLCSFRLGGTDGVSVEAAKWEWALRRLGFRTRRVAGELVDGLRPDDTWLPFLSIEPPPGAPPEPDALAASLAGADLVVVENLCSLPLNLTAATIAREVLADHAGRVLFHHHDLATERPHLAHLEGFPPDRPDSLHVTINDAARRTLGDRGIPAVTIRNAFDLDPEPGERNGTRHRLGFGADDLVVLQPTRAIARKEVGRGLELAARLGQLVADRAVRYWLTGGAEDGYEDRLARLIATSPVPFTHRWVPRVADAYAACDVVAFPSSLEGFGNPVVEALVADRPVVTSWYPVLDELIGLGLRVLSIDDPAAVARWLDHPGDGMRAANLPVLREHFDLARLPDRIERAFAAIAWRRW